MNILTRFRDIMSANINAILDRAEDPSKMVDQYLRDAMNDLANVKRETAGIMAEESRSKRLVDENIREVSKYEELAKKALLANNEDDAKVFIAKKQELETVGADLQKSYAVAHENAIKMREMHDKLVKNISDLNNRKELIKSKIAIARTQQKVNEIGTTSSRAIGRIGAFNEMEKRADKMLDEANAMAKLNEIPLDEAQILEGKYILSDSPSVDDELIKMKSELGM